MNLEKIKSKPIYPIRTAAEILGISVHTLRMYEREGLIIPHKTSSNQRSYSQEDIERVECIRNAINENKISINGIKTIYALIPCWELVKCSNKDRKNCFAYLGHTNPCWSYQHPKTICQNKECRECSVYKDHANCGQVKELIRKISGN